MTASWCIQVASEPRVVAVSVEARSLTRSLLEDSGAFSVWLLRKDQRELVRRFAKPAVFEAASMTLSGVAFLDGPDGLPIPEDAAGWITCRVLSKQEFQSHILFTGKVGAAGLCVPASQEAGPAGRVEVLQMSDTRMRYGG